MPNDFASFNFAKRAKTREIAKFNLAKVNPIKVSPRDMFPSEQEQIFNQLPTLFPSALRVNSELQL